MGGVGRVVGVLFFLALAVGAITSAISLLEVVTASIIDEFGIGRRNAAIGMGIVIGLFGMLSALSLDVLGLVDQIAGELLLAVGALFMAIFVGWVMKDPAAELRTGASPRLAGMVPGVLFLVKWLLPPVIAVVVWFQAEATWGVIRDFFGLGG
jgi:NSS family neurotransmitter:Na+ symporter